VSAGPLRIDRLTRAVNRGERAIGLLPREYLLLEYMMRHMDQLVTRAMLFTEVWGYKFVPRSNLVDVHLGRLRRKIDQPNEPPMIVSVRGQGFVLRSESKLACAGGRTSPAKTSIPLCSPVT
jgi:two-component system OmpR family response regulator